MDRYSILFVLLLCVLVDSNKRNRHHHNLRTFDKNQYSSPPYCTRLTKETDYNPIYKFDYPVAYILPGEKQAYQELYCVNPATVNKAVTAVCDWAAPPQVQFTLGDEHLNVVRQDPTGRFLGNAVITTYQLCHHALSHNGTRTLADVTVTAL